MDKKIADLKAELAEKDKRIAELEATAADAETMDKMLCKIRQIIRADALDKGSQ